MKKETSNLHRWIITVLLLSLSANAFAQGDEVLGPCQSYWHKYSNIRARTSLVRSDQDYRVIHTQRHDPSTGLLVHNFSILRYSSNIENYFSTTFDATVVTPYSVDITDMEIFEGVCYFCGTKTTNYDSPTYSYFTQDGIVGRFSPSAMQSGTGDLYFCIVPQTSQLTRLAISGPSQAIAQINAIGLMDDKNSSCLVELRENSATSWTSKLDHLPSIPKIYFSDILATRDSIILLSQLKCANDHSFEYDDYDINHQKFLLDRFSWEGCYHDCSPSPVTHYMAHYNLEDFANFHYNKAPMALSRFYYNWFAVAFGVKETESTNEGIRFFPFQNIWQYEASIYYHTGTNSKVVEMANRDLTSETFILSTDDINFHGIISSPYIASAPNFIRTIKTPGPTFNSLTQKANTSFLEIAGHDNTDRLNVFEQDVNLLSSPSCLNIITKDPIVFPQKSGALFYTDWCFQDIIINWQKAEISDIDKTESEIICKQCY